MEDDMTKTKPPPISSTCQTILSYSGEFKAVCGAPAVVCCPSYDDGFKSFCRHHSFHGNKNLAKLCGMVSIRYMMQEGFEVV